LNVYKENLADGIDIETIKQLVQDETWLTGEAAAKYFNITVTEENKAAACISGYFDKYKNAPKDLAKEKPDEPKNDTEKQKLMLEIDLLM
jgi:hypothetical protein